MKGLGPKNMYRAKGYFQLSNKNIDGYTYTWVDLWSCHECDKHWKYALTSSGKDMKRLTRKDKISWRKIMEYRIFHHAPPGIAILGSFSPVVTMKPMKIFAAHGC